jgi:Methyltransferase domain
MLADVGGLSQWFRQLDRVLYANRHLWQFRPFHYRDWYWEGSQPELCRALDALSDAEVNELESSPCSSAAFFSPWIQNLDEMQALAQLPAVIPRDIHPPERLDHGVPGRKWQQILAFASALPPSDSPLLEWCAGKGHLGRVLGCCDGRKITSLEWQEQLCRDGGELAQRAGAPVEFVQCDAFSDEAAQWIRPGADAIALHACGDLHTALMRHWLAQGGHQLDLSPCCYHLIQGEKFRPLSQAGRSAQVSFSNEDLRLPLQETVTAGAGVGRRREQEMLYRMAFDELQRAARAVDEYLNVPNVQKKLLTEGFTAFAQWAASRRQVTLPETIDAQRWLAAGRARLHRLRRMELVAHVFRRPLELWLVLDRTVFLEEQGARVQVREFCERDLTPRNILITALRAI